MTQSAAGPAKKRVAVFISGAGSNMMALADACTAADFPAKIVAVISDKASAGGIGKAKALGVETLVFERRDFAGKAEHEAAILAALDRIAPDIICLAGYMRLVSGDFVRRHQGHILNIHPSLLPLFPGLNTHQRAIDAGMRIAGCSVHFVTEGMDEGPIVAQAAIPILAGDTAPSLAARMIEVEHRLYPKALRLVAEGKARMEGGRTVLAPGSESGAEPFILSA